MNTIYVIRLIQPVDHTAESVRQAWARYKEFGQCVSPSDTKTIGFKPRKNFDTLIKEGLINENSEFNNNVPRGQPAKLIRQGALQLRSDLGKLQRTQPQSSQRGAKRVSGKAAKKPAPAKDIISLEARD